MNKKILFMMIPIVSVALIALACTPQVATTLPVAATEPTEIQPTDLPPEVPVITRDNAAKLAMVNGIETEPYIRLVWMKDSVGFWIIEYQLARPMNVLTLKKGPVAGVNEGGRVLDASPDGSRWAYDPDGTSSLILIDPADSDTDIITRPMQTIGDGRFTPDGKYLLTYSMDQWQATLWDAFTGEKVEEFEGFETAAPIYAVTPGADGQTLIWHARGTLQLQDMESGQMGSTFSHEDFITAFVLSPDGSVVATAAAGTINGNFTPAVYWWDAASGDKLAEMNFEYPIDSLSFSPDGDLLAVASGNFVTLVSSNFKIVATLRAHDEVTGDVAFSPDGRTLLTAGSEGQLKVWQVPAE